MHPKGTVFLSFLIGFVLLAGLSLAEDKSPAPRIWGRMQSIGILEYPGVNNTNRSPLNLYFFLKEARLGVAGELGSAKYDVQIAVGPEEREQAYATLMDYSIDIPFLSIMGVKVGQYVIPYSRERMADDGKLAFVSRSLNTTGFNIGRDSGLAVYGSAAGFYGIAGIFSGAGINIPVRYIPQLLGVPLTVVRVGFNNLDENLFTVSQLPEKTDGLKFAVSAGGIYEKDSRVGHSSAMISKKNDLSLLDRTSWNPYFKAYSAWPQSVKYQIGADAAIAVSISGLNLTGSVEANYGKFDNFTNGAPSTSSNQQLGVVEYIGGVSQIAASFGRVQIGLRYAILLPDERAGYQQNATSRIYHFVTSAPIHEITPSLSISINKWIKLIGDMQIGLNVPVSHEDKLGTINLLNQPDSVAVIANPVHGNGDTFPRSFTLAARLVLQAAF